jgi:hypothetical protein
MNGADADVGVFVVADADAPDGRARASVAARNHTAVVLVGRDAGALGLVAAALRDEAGCAERVAVYVGAPDDDALAEMISELFATGSG